MTIPSRAVVSDARLRVVWSWFGVGADVAWELCVVKHTELSVGGPLVLAHLEAVRCVVDLFDAVFRY